jgi:lysophospholipase L1-like esterase
MVVALAIFLLAGEALARALHIVDRLNGYGRHLYAPGPEPELPYLLRPGVRTTFFGTPVRVNGLGLRGPEMDSIPRPGVRRLLVVGDSVVFGQGLAEEETVANVLARRLDGAGGAPWEVVNAGVPGYDAVAEARWLARFGPGLHPAAVVVCTSLNDYDVAPRYAPTGVLVHDDPARQPPALVDRSEFLTLLRWAASYARGRLWWQMMARLEQQKGDTPATGEGGLDQLVERMHLEFYHHPEPAYWNRLRGAFLELAGLAAAQGFPLLVAVLPESYQVGVPSPDLTPQERLLALCRETHLDCVDLQPAFAAAGGQLFSNVQHPNARGHAVAAAAIADALASQRHQ